MDSEMMTALKRPFPANRIHWRVGATSGDKAKGIALAYIDARDVMVRLDEVCGDQWQTRYTHMKPAVCEIGIRLDGEWMWRANGAGDTDIEGDKGALSDAFKRAGVMWGIGRYLYQLPNVWCSLKQAGRSYALAETPTLPDWATPEGFDELMGMRAMKERHSAAVRAHLPSLNFITQAIADEQFDKAAEAWFELPEDDRHALVSLAPSKSGMLTTAERDFLKNKAHKYHAEDA